MREEEEEKRRGAAKLGRRLWASELVGERARSSNERRMHSSEVASRPTLGVGLALASRRNALVAQSGRRRRAAGHSQAGDKSPKRLRLSLSPRELSLSLPPPVLQFFPLPPLEASLTQSKSRAK